MPEILDRIPSLSTTRVEPLHELERHLLANQSRIEHWFRCQWQHYPPPFYTSVDLRNAGFKLAPVDTNLFPAGFNNLNPQYQPLYVAAVQHFLERYHPGIERVLLVPESHSRNLFYLENVWYLRQLLELAGLALRVGSLAVTEPTDVALPMGEVLRLEPLERRGGRLMVAGFDPELILLNNDLSAGVPEVLEGLEQPIVPPLLAGWRSRRKSAHFTHYQEAARELARVIDMDPWFIDPFHRRCRGIDFMRMEGLECLVRNVDEVLELIGAKYEQYGIPHRPFVIVKADAGTYGMGIMTVRSAEELRELNRKERTRMARSKEGLPVSDVFIQEGVYTFETTSQGAVAEPVVYLVGQQVLGGFFRVHTERGVDENLNAPGARFEPMAFGETCVVPCLKSPPDAACNRYYAYGVIARLATVAAAREQRSWGEGAAS